jgi:hypothetical protein
MPALPPFSAISYNSFGEAGVTTTPANFLSVSFTGPSQFSILTLNGSSADAPFLGGIVGFASSSDNLGTGSFNYAYLGGTAQTASGAAPGPGASAFDDSTGIPEDIESAIWPLNGSNALLPQWLNTDLSQPPIFIMDITNILVLTGDPAAFQDTFGSAEQVNLTFVGTTTKPEPSSVLLVGLGVGVVGLIRARQQK